MNAKAWLAPVALWMAGCAGEATPTAPQIEQGTATLTPEQEARCDALRRRGARTPWYCGGRESAPPPSFGGACVEDRWVGLRLEAGPCLPAEPSATGEWAVSEPFRRSRDARLRRTCRYTWTAQDVRRPAPDVAALPDDPSLRLERECQVVAGHAVPQPVADLLFESWQAQIEAPDWSASDPFAPSPVRVAVIDGVGGGPQGFADAGAFGVPHAVAVSSAIRALTCPEQGDGAFCSAGTPNYIAMPWIAPGQLGELGGFFGTQSDFATAVADAVDDWRETPPGNRPPRLILNLSLGWDGVYDVTNEARVGGAIALWALEYASCQDALLIAAAGNRAIDSDQGPLFPAAYERRARTCGTASPAWAYQPLVHAVGGVDARDQPLSLARAGGTPRLVAPGSMVVTPEDTAVDVDRPTAVLSGTSMSAAAVSGAAALLWSMRPGATGDMVMEALYQTGEALGRDAEFGLPGDAQPQRRLALGRAFDLACPQGVLVGGCPQGGARPALPAPRAAGVDAGVSFGDLVNLLYLNAVLSTVADDPPPLPQGTSAYVDPYVVPQPGTPNCDVCGIWEGQLYGQLDPNLAGSLVSAPVLEYKNDLGDILQVELDPLPEKDPFKVDLTSALKNDVVLSAWLVIPAQINGETVYTRSDLDVD